MKNRQTTVSRRRTIIVFSSIVILVISLSIVYWNKVKKKIVKDKLETILANKTKGLYKIEYNQLQLDEIAGTLSISGISLFFDSTIVTTLKGTVDEPAVLIKLFIPQLQVTGVSTPKALLGQEIKGKRLEILNPTIELIYTPGKNDSSIHIPTNRLYEQVLENFTQINIEQILLVNGKLVSRDQKADDTSAVLEGVSLTLNQFTINKENPPALSAIFFSDSWVSSINSIVWYQREGFYKYKVEGIKSNSDSASVYINKFSLLPLLSETAFMDKANAQVDRLDISLENILLSNINFDKLFVESLVADSLSIEKTMVKVYKDFSRPRDQVNRVGTFPHQLLLKIPFTIKINRATIRDGYVEYKQFTPKTGEKARLFFTRVLMAINNITNDSVAISKNNTCRADVACLFLDKVKLKTSFSFNLASSNGRFSIDARLAGFNAGLLNKITQPLAATKIERGRIEGASMQINGSDYKGHATVSLKYDNLKIAVMEKRQNHKGLSKKPLVSFAANAIIKNSNPGNNGNLRITKGEFDRDTNRGFFNLVWRSLYVAIAETIGITAKSNRK